ncbi:hypothetical protein [Puia sp.]|jgi:hypothetical protein|uniref:hypothetical protein n=1 Tax=Puia sp. TaxID=2045100 RepID=UPI002F424AE6
MENKQPDSFLGMQLDYDGGNILRETVRWSRFLSIVGFIALALFLLAFGLAGSTLLATFSRVIPAIEGLAELGTALVVIGLLVIFAIFGFLVFMLYRFSVLTRQGIEHQDQVAFAKGMQCLHTYFVVAGIVAFLSLLSNLLSLTKLFNA